MMRSRYIRSGNESGFTMIELMMAVLIMGIVTGQLFMVFSSQKRTFSANMRVLDVQEDARLVVDLIGFDARNAGFMVPGDNSIVSADGGSTDPDRICVSDSSYFEYPVTGGPGTELDDRDSGFSGADVSSFVDDFNLEVDSLDIDGNGTTDFQDGAGIIISNGVRFACVQIDTITAGTPNNISIIADHQLSAIAWVGDALPTQVVPAVIYELDTTDLSLQRNGLVLATNVEDLQIEYWIDGWDDPGTSGVDEKENGQIDTDELIHDLSAAPPANVTVQPRYIRRATIGVITRTAMEEANVDGKKVTTFSRRPALANRTAGGADGFQRRRFSAAIQPRNLN